MWSERKREIKERIINVPHKTPQIMCFIPALLFNDPTCSQKWITGICSNTSIFPFIKCSSSLSVVFDYNSSKASNYYYYCWFS